MAGLDLIGIVYGSSASKDLFTYLCCFTFFSACLQFIFWKWEVDIFEYQGFQRNEGGDYLWAYHTLKQFILLFLIGYFILVSAFLQLYLINIETGRYTIKQDKMQPELGIDCISQWFKRKIITWIYSQDESRVTGQFCTWKFVNEAFMFIQKQMIKSCDNLRTKLLIMINNNDFYKWYFQ